MSLGLNGMSMTRAAPWYSDMYRPASRMSRMPFTITWRFR